MKKRATGSAAKIPQSARRPLLLRYDYKCCLLYTSPSPRD